VARLCESRGRPGATTPGRGGAPGASPLARCGRASHPGGAQRARRVSRDRHTAAAEQSWDSGSCRLVVCTVTAISSAREHNPRRTHAPNERRDIITTSLPDTIDNTVRHNNIVVQFYASSARVGHTRSHLDVDRYRIFFLLRFVRQHLLNTSSSGEQQTHKRNDNIGIYIYIERYY